MRHSLCWLPVLNLKKSTSSESSSVSISLSLLYPTLSPDSTLSCQRLRTRGPQIAAAAAAAAIAGGEGIKMCSLSLPLSPLSFSLSLCCAQRMFIQALSSQLSVDWAFHQSHTAWNQAAWAKPHRGERQKECGFVCLRMGLCMLDQKRGKTMGKKSSVPVFHYQLLQTVSCPLHYEKSACVSHRYPALWPKNDTCHSLI